MAIVQHSRPAPGREVRQRARLSVTLGVVGTSPLTPLACCGLQPRPRRCQKTVHLMSDDVAAGERGHKVELGVASMLTTSDVETRRWGTGGDSWHKTNTAMAKGPAPGRRGQL